MHANYEINLDAERRLVRLRLVGMWDLNTVAAYRRDLDDAMRRMKTLVREAGNYLLLIDVREQGVQSHEIAAACQDIIAQYAPLSRRTALVMSTSAVHAMQVKRISGEFERSFFDDEGSALAWLLN